MVNRTGYHYRPQPPRWEPGKKTPAPPIEAVDQNFPYIGQPSDRAHVRNFLDCVKSREKPVVDIEDGFYATLPTIMGMMAVRTGKTYAWDGKQAKAV